MQKLLLYVLCILLPVVAFAQEEWDGYMLAKVKGSEVYYQELLNYGQYKFVTGPVKDEKIETFTELEGRISRTLYTAPKSTSAFEIFATYKKLLEKKGFEIVFSGSSKECNWDFHKQWYGLNPFDSDRNYSYSGAITGGGMKHYIAAKKTGTTGPDKYASILVTQGWWDYAVYRVDVVEIKEIATEMESTSDDFSESLSTQGRIAFYGIYFDTGKSNIKAESTPTLNKIAVYLKSNPNEKFYIVGHTDDAGDFNANMTLSMDRAKAVELSLVNNYGINTARLTPQGVGPLSPVASNTTEDGRAKNRRVEMVLTSHTPGTGGTTSAPGKTRSMSAGSRTMPDVRGLTVTAALQQLKLIGISPDVLKESDTPLSASQVTGIPDFDIKFGAAMAADGSKSRHQRAPITIVKSQIPGPGDNMDARANVTLRTILVNTSKPLETPQVKPQTTPPPPADEGLVPVPNVVGKMRLSAKNMLKRQGFQVKLTGKKVGKVKSQSPGANQEVKPGSTITLTIGK